MEAKSEKREASQKRAPLFDEPVGGRLIGVLYWPSGGEWFQLFLQGPKRRQSEALAGEHRNSILNRNPAEFDPGTTPPQPCFVFRLSRDEPARRAGHRKARLFRSLGAWRKNDWGIAWPSHPCGVARPRVLRRKPAKVKSHRGIFRTNHIYVSSESLSGDPWNSLTS